VADLFKEEKEKRSIEKHRTTDYEAETGFTHSGTQVNNGTGNRNC